VGHAGSSRRALCTINRSNPYRRFADTPSGTSASTTGRHGSADAGIARARRVIGRSNNASARGRNGLRQRKASEQNNISEAFRSCHGVGAHLSSTAKTFSQPQPLGGTISTHAAWQPTHAAHLGAGWRIHRRASLPRKELLPDQHPCHTSQVVTLTIHKYSVPPAPVVKTVHPLGRSDQIRRLFICNCSKQRKISVPKPSENPRFPRI
jgi:hypothetical protein